MHQKNPDYWRAVFTETYGSKPTPENVIRVRLKLSRNAGIDELQRKVSKAKEDAKKISHLYGFFAQDVLKAIDKIYKELSNDIQVLR